MTRRAGRMCLRCRANAEQGDLCARCRRAGNPYSAGTYRRAQRSARGYLGKTCPLCGQVMTQANPPSVDHIDPVRAGGGSESSNLRVICRRCNGREI